MCRLPSAAPPAARTPLLPGPSRLSLIGSHDLWAGLWRPLLVTAERQGTWDTVGTFLNKRKCFAGAVWGWGAVLISTLGAV